MFERESSIYRGYVTSKEGQHSQGNDIIIYQIIGKKSNAIGFVSAVLSVSLTRVCIANNKNGIKS